MSVDCSTYAGIDSVASPKSFPTPPPSSRWSAVLDVDVEEADVVEGDDSEEASGKAAPWPTPPLPASFAPMFVRAPYLRVFIRLNRRMMGTSDELLGLPGGEGVSTWLATFRKAAAPGLMAAALGLMGLPGGAAVSVAPTVVVFVATTAGGVAGRTSPSFVSGSFSSLAVVLAAPLSAVLASSFVSGAGSKAIPLASRNDRWPRNAADSRRIVRPRPFFTISFHVSGATYCGMSPALGWGMLCEGGEGRGRSEGKVSTGMQREEKCLVTGLQEGEVQGCKRRPSIRVQPVGEKKYVVAGLQEGDSTPLEIRQGNAKSTQGS